MKPRFWVHLALSLLISGFLLFVQTETDDSNLHSAMADEMLFLDIGHKLNAHGVYTNGFYERRANAPDDLAGDLIAPATPALVAAVGYFYPSFQGTVDCIKAQTHKDPSQPCWDTMFPGIVAKGLVVMLTLAFLFALTYVAFEGRLWVAYLAPVLYFICDDKPFFLQYFMTENLSLLFLAAWMLASLLMLKAMQNQEKWIGLALLSGIALGLATLNKPSHLYLLIPLALVFLSLLVIRFVRFRPSATAFALVTLATFVTVLPWVLRNGLVTGTFDVTGSYDGLILNQRLYYNQIDLRDWFAGLIYHLPDFGDKLAIAWFPPEVISVWDMEDRDGLFWQSQVPLNVGADGYPDTAMLIKDHLLPNFGKHLWTSLVISWRGLFIGDYFTLFGLPIALYAAWQLLRTEQAWIVLLLGIPTLFQIGFHGFVSVGVARYNMLLILFICPLVAWQLANWFGRLSRRWRAA